MAHNRATLFSPSISFVIPAGVSVRGGYSEGGDYWDPETYETILSGNINNDQVDYDNSFNVVDARGATGSRLEGLTVREGYGDETAYTSGGGILCGEVGGEDGDMEIVQCKIVSNSANGNGGGIYCSGDDCELTIVDCNISDNTSMQNSGGGMYCNGSNATIANTTISGNEAYIWGGGVHFVGSTSAYNVMSNCMVIGNTATYFGNTGSGGGGVHLCTNAYADIINCTFSSNSAPRHPDVESYSGGSATLWNCVIWGSAATDSISCPSCLEQQGVITASYCDFPFDYDFYEALQDEVFQGTGNIDANPLFTENYYHLGSNSPCIDAGDPGFVPASYARRDIDGQFRIWYWDYDWYVDMGADEYDSNRYGDLDGDDDVDQDDLTKLRRNFGSPKTPADGDMDMDGDVDYDDEDILESLL